MNKLMHGVVSLRPFVPAKDFGTSKCFYLDLGFSVLHEDAHVAGLGLGPHEFLLQNFYVKEFADNFMMHLMVDDADAWWAHIQALDLPQKYDVSNPNPPKEGPGNLKVFHLVDPSGVLWHVTQLLSPAGKP